MFLSRLSGVASGMVLATVLILSGVSAQAESTVLRIGYLRSPEALNLSRIQGTFEKALAPLDVKVEWKGPFGAFAPSAEALNANAIDLALGSSTAALTVIAGDAPLSLLSYGWDNGDDAGIVVRSGSPIKSVRDLVGKTVAVNRGGTGEYMLSRAMEKAGIPIGEVKKAYLSPPDSAAALSQNKIDAWAAWSTFFPVALAELDARSIAVDQDYDAENATVFVVRTEFARKNPKIMGVLLASLRQANAWLVKNPEEAAALWVKELKVSPATAKLIANFRNNPPLPIKEKELAALERQNTWLVDQKILRQKADIQNHIVTDFGGVPFD